MTTSEIGSARLRNISIAAISIFSAIHTLIYAEFIQIIHYLSPPPLYTNPPTLKSQNSSIKEIAQEFSPPKQKKI